MAGFYPDVLSHRIPWDRNETLVKALNPDEADYIANPLSAAALNSEAISTSGLKRDNWLALVFSQPTDLEQLFVTTAGGGGGSRTYRVSTDTTNGLDGTWSSGTYSLSSAASRAAMRTGIQARSHTGIVGLRLQSSPHSGTLDGISNVHLYGVTSGDNVLEIWHPTLDQRADPAHFDWGDTRRSTSADRTFRVKNSSPTMRAVGPVVSIEARTDASPSVPGQHLLSLDGTAFASSRVLPNLEPGAISGVITLRRNLVSNADLFLWWARVAAVAALWEVA